MRSHQNNLVKLPTHIRGEPQKEVFLYLFAELPKAPLLEQATLDPDTGQPVDRAIVQPSGEARLEFLRLLQCAVVMDPRRARDLGRWLVAQSDEILGGEA